MHETVCFGTLFDFNFAACNNDSDSNATQSGGEKDPSVTQPPSEAIIDSTKIVNDSVIVPDTTPGNGRQVRQSDSIQKNC
jgi:hypothetical protein